MDLQIAGTNVEITPDLRKYIERKLGKMKRYLSNVMDAKIELSEEKTKSPENRFLVRVSATSKGAVFHSEERGIDLFTAIDKVAPIISRQLEQRREKQISKRRSSVSFARTRLGEESDAAANPRKLVKTKRFVIEAMKISEGIERMEALGHDFFLFLDAESQGLQLLYRRKDGNYGLIVPETASHER